MSTSLLYHAFGIRGYDYVRTDYQDGRVIFTITQDPEDWRCSACGAGRSFTQSSSGASGPCLSAAGRRP